MKLSKFLGLTATATLLAGTAVVAGLGTAQAALLGTMTLNHPTGDSNTVIDATTDGECAPTTAGIIVAVTGAGVAPPDNNLMGFTDPGVVDEGDHYVLQLTSTFFDIFQANGVNNPSGNYTVTVQCIADDFITVADTFELVTTWTPSGTNFVGTYTTPVDATDTTTLLSGPSSSNFGDSVTLTAAVTPTSATGTVQFKDGAANLGAPQTVGAGGIATFTTSALGAGPHSLTAVYLPGPGFDGSTSNALSLTVASTGTSLGLASNGPTAEFATATFTATVSPAAAGTVTFKEGATTLGTTPVNGAGIATFSTTSLAVGTHSVTADFTPADPVNVEAATAGPVDHVVTAFAGDSVTENIIVEVPAGALTIVLDDGADGLVDLGVAQMNAAGDLLTASGDMDVVKITDTRAGDPGWTASGVVTDFTNGTDSVNGYNLGWTPEVVTLSANQTANFHLGSQVLAAAEGTAGSTPADAAAGLESARELGSAPDNSGNGTARLGALLDLNIPTDVSAGVYAATLTLTVI